MICSQLPHPFFPQRAVLFRCSVSSPYDKFAARLPPFFYLHSLSYVTAVWVSSKIEVSIRLGGLVLMKIVLFFPSSRETIEIGSRSPVCRVNARTRPSIAPLFFFFFLPFPNTIVLVSVNQSEASRRPLYLCKELP